MLNFGNENVIVNTFDGILEVFVVGSVKHEVRSLVELNSDIAKLLSVPCG